MKKFFTLMILSMVIIQFATVFCLLNANAYVYENRTFMSELIFNTTPDDIISTQLLTNADYKDNDSIEMRNVNYQILPFSLFQTFYQNVDYKYNATSNITTNITSLYGYSGLPVTASQFLLYERQLKQRTTEFQTLIVMQEPSNSQSNRPRMNLIFDFYDTNNQLAVMINFSSNMFWQFESGIDTYYSNTTNISIQTNYANYTTTVNGSIWQLTDIPLLFDIIFDFNSIELQINRVDYRYLEYQTNSVNTTVSTTATYSGDTYHYEPFVYFNQKINFNYIDVEAILSKLVFNRTRLDNGANVNQKVFIQAIDSSIISPYSLYIPTIIPNQQVLRDSFIEDTLFYHNRCDQFYNYYYDTTDLTLLQNPLVYNVNSYTEFTNQLRYIGDYVYASNESLNFYIPKSQQIVTPSLYPRNVCLPTWKMNNTSSFVYQSNKTYFPDTQLDAFHVYYQTNATTNHHITVKVFSKTCEIEFDYVGKRIIIGGIVTDLDYQNMSFRNFDMYFYPRRESDGTQKLTCYLEFFGQKSYILTNHILNLYGIKHNNTLVVDQSFSTNLWFATCENVNLYRAYNSTVIDIHHATKQYRYKCVYETLIRKVRYIDSELYAEAPLMSQLSQLKGYYFTKLGIFSQQYETQHLTAMRSESQTNMDFENTTIDLSYTNNETYEVTGSVIGASSLNNGQAKIITLQSEESENANLTPTASNRKDIEGLVMSKPKSQFVVTALLIGIGLLATVFVPIVITEIKHHDEPINSSNTPYGGVGARQMIRNAIDWVDKTTQPLQDGWNTIVNASKGIWNTVVGLTEGINPNLNVTQHFNVVIVTASTILQYENTDATFDMLTYIINIAIPIVILILFVFLMKRFHTKLAILGFFIGIVMLYIMDYISLKFAIVLSLLFIIFAWVYLYVKKEPDGVI